MTYFEFREDTYGDFQLQTFVYDILPKDKNSKILDVGCGLCKYLSRIKELGYLNLKGIDIEKTAVEACKKFDIEAELVEDIIDYSDHSVERYDFIILTHVLEHIEKPKVIPTLKALKNLLTVDGKLFIVVPNAQSNTNCYWAYEDFTHQTLYTSGSLLYVLRSAGFVEINFIDTDCLNGVKFFRRQIKKIFLGLYKINFSFWNKVTKSQFHEKSPLIFSFEIKVLAN